MEKLIGIAGAKELEKVLKMLPNKVSENVLSRSVSSGATIVKNEVKKNAARFSGKTHHPQYGTLRDNIRKKKLKYQRGKVTYAVDTGDAFWAHFLEYGTGRYYEGPGSSSKGEAAKTHMPAQPFFRPAWDASHEKAMVKIIQRLKINIEKAAEQLSGRYGKMSKAMRRRIAK